MSVTVRESPIIWAGIVSSLAHGMLLTLVIGWADAGSVAGGFKTGAIVGFLLWLGADLILYATFDMGTLTGALAGSVLALVPSGDSWCRDRRGAWNGKKLMPDRVGKLLSSSARVR